MFIQYLAEQGHNIVKSERKPRKNIQYRDLGTSQCINRHALLLTIYVLLVANAVARIDNLEFLSDVIPRTVPYKQVKNSKQPKERVNDDSVERGQTTLDRKKRRSDVGRTSDSTLDFAAVEDEDDSTRSQGHRLSMEIRGPRSNGAPKQGAKPSNGTTESDEEME